MALRQTEFLIIAEEEEEDGGKHHISVSLKRYLKTEHWSCGFRLIEVSKSGRSRGQNEQTLWCRDDNDTKFQWSIYP